MNVFADLLRRGAHRSLLHGRSLRLVDKILARCVWADRGYKDGPCLEWQGPTSGEAGRGRNGRGHSYPRMNVDGHTAAVHRALWTCLNGYLPSRRQLDHLCCNRRCVLHCEPVTHKQNQKRKRRT